MKLTGELVLQVRDLSMPVVLRPAVPMTDAQLLRFSAANDLFRVERTANSELHMMTVGGDGGRLELYLARELDAWAERDGRGLVFPANTGFKLRDGAILSPDAAWVSRGRWESLTRTQKRQYLPFCPEFVAEIRSPGDRLSPLTQKMEQWIDYGAELAWMIDPQRKTASIYRKGEGAAVAARPDFLNGEGPIAGFRLKMDRFWS
jgi:Uma2 family endonuclease